MTTEWQREGSTDPRFDLTEQEVDRLKFLSLALTQPVDEFGVGAVRAYMSGEPVCVLVSYEENADNPNAVDMRPMAVLMNDHLFGLITPPPEEGEDT